MTQPTRYVPSTDFSEEESGGVSGRSELRTAAVDAELAAVQATLDEICDNLAIIQRDDTALRDGIVELHSLSEEVRTLLASGAFTIRGTWVTGTAYTQGDIVYASAIVYLCVEDHTSGVFDDDLADEKWGALTNNSATAIAAHISDVDGAHASSAISFLPSGTGAVARSVQEQLRDIHYNIKGYDAEGDGTTNDATAINNAVTAASNAGGGTVFVPESIFFSQTINGASKVNFRGLGGGSIIKFDDDGTQTSRNLYLNAVNDVIIENITFDSDGASRSGVYGLIRIEGCNRITIRKCKFLTSPSVAIYVANSNDVLIEGNEIGDGTSFCYADGIHVNRQSSRVRIIGNTIRGTRDDAIGIVSNKDSGTYTANVDVLVEGNTISGTTTNGSGIAVVGGIGIVVKGNICKGAFPESGVYVQAPGDATYNAGEDIIVEGNVCSGATNHGINIVGLDKGVVSGNVCFGNTLEGIQLATSSLNITVTGNLCHDNGDYGIYEEAASGPNVFIGNVVRDNTSGQMLINGGTGSIIARNVGFVTEARGTSNIPSGSTTKTITHGLSVTPNPANISVLFTEQGTNDYGRWWVDNVTSTQFTVNVSADPGVSNLDFYWQVMTV